MMTSGKNHGLRTLLLVAFVGGATGCGDEPQRSNTRGGGRGGGAAKAEAAEQEPGEGDEAKEAEPVVFTDDDFVESLRNRDPFMSYSTVFSAEAPEDIQRRVLMPSTSVDEMRLIAIITGLPRPKAMLVDRANVGHVVQRGDYIGRPKVIQASGSVSMQLNWRVDRIRENEVVLTQQDPADPTRTALTKIIVLNEEVAER
jgi:hypothetical protein